MQRIINSILFIAIAVGVVQLVRSQRALTIVQAEHARLSGKYGSLEVKDPSKFLVHRVDTGDSKHFLWHCYIPAGLRLEKRYGFGASRSSGSRSMYADAGTYLYRCRFDVYENTLRAHLMERGGGGRHGFNRKPVLDFVLEHWDELEFDVIAEDGEATVDTSEALNFLTIRIPDSMRADFEAAVGKKLARRYGDVPFFHMQYGTSEAFEAADKREANK